MHVGLWERNLDAVLSEHVVDVLLDASKVGQACLDGCPKDHLQVDTALPEVLEEHLYALLAVIMISVKLSLKKQLKNNFY